jgi:hypothetical protein
MCFGRACRPLLQGSPRRCAFYWITLKIGTARSTARLMCAYIYQSTGCHAQEIRSSSITRQYSWGNRRLKLFQRLQVFQNRVHLPFHFQRPECGKSRNLPEIWLIFQICSIVNIGAVSCTSSTTTLRHEEMKVKLHAFLTYTFEAVEWLASYCGHFNRWGAVLPGRLNGPQNRSGNSDKDRKRAPASNRTPFPR